jgi:hypothetical protein
MKRLSYIMTLIPAMLIAGNSFSQQVIATAGSSGSGTGIQLSWTIGEPVTSTAFGTDFILTQGFHQIFYTIQELSFLTGWNLMSMNVIPDNKNLMTILQPIIDAGKLKKVMDETGKVIENRGAFGGWVNSIGDMQNTEGYKINVLSPATVEVQGVPVSLPLDIPLRAGWNIISWPAAGEQDGMDVFQSLIDDGKLKKVMDETGKVIENRGAFGGWVNSINNLRPGEGYKVNVLADCILTINGSGAKSETIQEEQALSAHFIPAYTGNGVDHMNIYLVDIDKSGLMKGDEIGVFDGGICVGAGRITDQNLSNSNPTAIINLIASADDGMDEVNGFTQGREPGLKLYRNGKEHNLTLTPVNSGNMIFERGGTLFAKVDLSTESEFINNNFAVKCYPNPFSDVINIEISLSKTENLNVEIYDMHSKLVKQLFNGVAQNTVVLQWNGQNSFGNKVAPGVYICRVNNVWGKVIYNHK